MYFRRKVNLTKREDRGTRQHCQNYGYGWLSNKAHYECLLKDKFGAALASCSFHSRSIQQFYAH